MAAKIGNKNDEVPEGKVEVKSGQKYQDITGAETGA
jgi:hypothetical protein